MQQVAPDDPALQSRARASDNSSPQPLTYEQIVNVPMPLVPGNQLIENYTQVLTAGSNKGSSAPVSTMLLNSFIVAGDHQPLVEHPVEHIDQSGSAMVGRGKVQSHVASDYNSGHRGKQHSGLRLPWSSSAVAIGFIHV